MTTPFPRTTVLIGLAAVLLSAAGCTTRGFQRAAATSTSMERAASELEEAQTQIIVATTALDSMVNQPQQDLRPLFRQYRESVADVENTYNDLLERSNRLAQQKEAYMATWDQRNSEIQNADIRDRSLERQREVTEDFARAQRAAERAQQTLQPLLTELRDIQRLLSVDLTAAGVAMVRQVADRARQNAQEARSTLGEVAQEFRSVSATLDPQTLAAAE